MTGDYHGEDEHTHAQRVPFLVWALLAGLLILAVSVAALSRYVIGRVTIGDQRNERSVQAVCAVLDSIPASHRTAAMRKARRLDDCDHVPLPATRRSRSPQRPTPDPTVTGASGAAISSPPVVVHRTGHPHPTATRTMTSHPHPSPSSSRQPSHRPSPSPSPTRTACLNLPKPLPPICK